VSFIIYITILSICVASILAKKSSTSSPTKVILILVIIHGYLTIGTTYKQVSGYPTVENFPKKFEIIWARVIEPPNDDRFIEIWIDYENILVDKLISRFSLAHGWNNISRVHRMPYNADNHQMVLEIQEKISRGEKVGIKLEDTESGKDVDLRKSEKKYNIEFESRKIVK
tara:strand:+ start:3265 stop:3774 length:510 start_codon:yes stop_codon:yes gene_type:complete